MSPRPVTDEPDEPAFVGEGVRATRATGCFRNLSWNLELDGFDWEQLRAALGAEGWAEASPLEGLFDYAVPEGAHHLVVVPRSQWIQLRLSYLLPEGERFATMRALAERMAALVTSRTTRRPGSRCARRSRRRRRTSP